MESCDVLICFTTKLKVALEQYASRVRAGWGGFDVDGSQWKRFERVEKTPRG